MRSRFSPTLVLLVCLVAATGRADQPDSARLAESLKPLVDCLSGRREAFRFSAAVDVQIDQQPVHVDVRWEQAGADLLSLEIRHQRYQVRLERRADRTALILPLHGRAYVGDGPVTGSDTLAPRGMLQRLVSQESLVGMYLPLIAGGDEKLLALMLTAALNPQYDADTNTWSHKQQYFLHFAADGQQVEFRGPNVRVECQLDDAQLADETPIPLDGLTITKLDRRQLERHLARAIRRGLAVAAPSPLLTRPEHRTAKVAGGELFWVGDQRVVVLRGTPEQIGRAHGQLLKDEIHRCLDSVLYMFGTVQTIRTGEWFPQQLAAAYERLAPHIPERHRRETVAMAEAAGVDPREALIVNVFPELFHCSGFAVFGRATKDGKLYHGRVLDYMTVIGLQDAATTMVIAPDGFIPFVTVGYAGFTGSVSGMNAEAISLGEMGGGGEGQWDGVPMATLMRRALEECRTLADVQRLWSDSPRTCQYYYVFADGKTRQAVGVAATPQTIEFVRPGQGHPLLGEGIPDAVLLSSGDRLRTLRLRVQERYGQIDAETAQWLMSRPVAMKSNLHNVLFVPEDRVLFVAHADHRHSAAERPYVRLDLMQLLARSPISLDNGR